MAGRTPVSSSAKRLLPPPGGAVVRMYRIGHGDCFLIAFDGDEIARPVYVLIDCGYKPGSAQYVNTTIKQVTQDIRDATGDHIDVVVITHEHQDHVNGFTKANFDGVAVGQVWLAWTEDPNDELANHLKDEFQAKLRGVIASRNRLAATGNTIEVAQIDELLTFEFGDAEMRFDVGGVDGVFGYAASSNRGSMDLVRRLSGTDPLFIRPHDRVIRMPGTSNVNVFALGPPRDAELLRLLEPEGAEAFYPVSNTASYFAAAAGSGKTLSDSENPFEAHYSIGFDRLSESEFAPFFTEHYGAIDSRDQNAAITPEATAWRRIDGDWLQSGSQLALDMNRQTNNSSLVLAFELGTKGKVLLFAADAQRGNWASWANADWQHGDTRVTTRDLLARTVLYKVGHHGSHNATLNGRETDSTPNLSWMGTGLYSHEFTAMIPAVRAWAETQKGWDHPLPAIKNALLKKACGRVFQTDTNVDQMKRTTSGPQMDWQAFVERVSETSLYFDYRIPLEKERT